MIVKVECSSSQGVAARTRGCSRRSFFCLFVCFTRALTRVRPLCLAPFAFRFVRQTRQRIAQRRNTPSMKGRALARAHPVGLTDSPRRSWAACGGFLVRIVASSLSHAVRVSRALQRKLQDAGAHGIAGFCFPAATPVVRLAALVCGETGPGRAGRDSELMHNAFVFRPGLLVLPRFRAFCLFCRSAAVVCLSLSLSVCGCRRQVRSA